MKNCFFALAIFIMMIPSAFGQTPEKKQYKATYIKTAPVIDGILDEEVWKEGTWIDDFTQFQPYNGQKPYQRTEFNIIFDDNNIYFGVKCFDTSPDSVVKRLTRRDQIDGDQVGVLFDSYHDLRTGFLFSTSASGVKADQMMTNDGENEDSNWDPNWWVKTSVNNEGWVAEMKIPFSQLRFEKGSTEAWGLEVFRQIYRKQEMDLWQHIPKDAPGLVHLFGEMNGIEKVKPRKVLDITPYGVARAESFQSEEGNPFLQNGRKFGGNAGLDAKIGVTNNMTMDLTINPDFGQVEADPSVVNLTAYETFYEEKRPFFIEGKNITSFNLGLGDGDVGNDNLFYTRRIGRRPQGYPSNMEEGWYADIPSYTNIYGAAKLTGKSKNGLSVGIVEAVTAEEVAVIDTVGGRMNETVEPLTNYAVGRIQRDFKDGNTIIGGMFTGTNRDLTENLAPYLHKAAYTGGLDFTQYFKNKAWMFNINSAFSGVTGSSEAITRTQTSSARYYQRPDNDYTELDSSRTSLYGTGGRMQLVKNEGELNYGALVMWKTPGFETNDLGYLREADQILPVIFIGFHEKDPKGIFRSYNINGNLVSIFNFGGDWLYKSFEGNFNMNFRNYWSVFSGGNVSGQGLSTGMLRGGPMMKMPGNYSYRLGFNSDNRKKLEFGLFSNINGGYQGSSLSLYAQAEISYKPTNYLRISLNPGYSKSFDELQYVSEQSYGSEPRYIFGSIDQTTISASIRISLNFTPDLTLQYWGQPFVSSGTYYDYKYITDPMADQYHDRFHVYTDEQLKWNTDGYYEVDENVDSNIDYEFGKPDFNFQEFLSNLVIRWEYNPGSSLYLVWSQTRNDYSDVGNLDLMNDMSNLFNSAENKPHNVFLIKLTYRFGLR
jgi:hypothetical protein